MQGFELAILVSIVSGLTPRSIQTQICVLGSMSIGGTIIPTSDLTGTLQIAANAGDKMYTYPRCRHDAMWKGIRRLVLQIQYGSLFRPSGCRFQGVGN